MPGTITEVIEDIIQTDIFLETLQNRIDEDKYIKHELDLKKGKKHDEIIKKISDGRKRLDEAKKMLEVLET